MSHIVLIFTFRLLFWVSPLFTLYLNTACLLQKTKKVPTFILKTKQLLCYVLCFIVNKHSLQTSFRTHSPHLIIHKYGTFNPYNDIFFLQSFLIVILVNYQKMQYP